MPLCARTKLPLIGTWTSVLAHTSFTAWNKFRRILSMIAGRSPISSYTFGLRLSSLKGLISKRRLNFRSRFASVRCAIPIKQRTPTLNMRLPAFSPTNMFTLRVATRLSTWMSSQIRSYLSRSINDISCLLMCSGNASKDSLAMSVFMNPRNWFKTLPFTRMTLLNDKELIKIRIYL